MSELNLQERLLSFRNRPVIGRLSYSLLKLLGIEIPKSVILEGPVELPHGAHGLVVHRSTRIGSRVKIYQGVTIGRGDTYKPDSELPGGGGVVISDDVVLGAGSKILFDAGEILTLGTACVVGANAVVTKSVPPREIWAGIPASKISDRP